MSQLNPQQREAVRYIDSPLLVLAGAGSGKTSVITRKIAYLIEQCGIEARHIAAVTFTNKASREMRERVGQLVRGEAARGLTISTFHTLGLNILRREHQKLGYKSGFSIFDAEDARALVRDLLIQEHGGDADQSAVVQARISAWKNDLVDPERARTLVDGPADMLCAEAYVRYQRALRAYNALDFDDLILLPVQLFASQPEVLDSWQRRIRYLLVDEYQDTNGAQYQLVKQLVGRRNGLTVVGDDDQSIYAWRGARPENMVQLQSDYPGLKVIKLEQNYRSTGIILRAANRVIGNNPHVFEKRLWSELGPGDPIRILRCRNEELECERVAMEILDHRIRRGGRFGDYAVLYRGNHQARLLEIKLQAHQVPYRISGGTSFFSRNEIKDVMAYLRLVMNPDDDNAFLRIINVPRRKIGSSTLEGLGRYATERGISLYAACPELGLEQHIPEASVGRLREFTQWMDQLRQDCAQRDPVAAIHGMLDTIDYAGWLQQNASSNAVAERRMGNVMVLIESLKTSMERAAEDGGEASIDDAIARLVLRDLLERQEEEDEALDKVQLMTLHASKGLEFPHVYIIGMEEELLPHHSSLEAEGLEEERRLCYVGITRAQRSLTLTWCARRKQFGDYTECTPSRFLDELPQEDVIREGGEAADAALNQQRGRETLAGLKNLFD